jgi:hypothetical protein
MYPRLIEQPHVRTTRIPGRIAKNIAPWEGQQECEGRFSMLVAGGPQPCKREVKRAELEACDQGAVQGQRIRVLQVATLPKPES